MKTLKKWEAKGFLEYVVRHAVLRAGLIETFFAAKKYEIIFDLKNARHINLLLAV